MDKENRSVDDNRQELAIKWKYNNRFSGVEKAATQNMCETFLRSTAVCS